MMNEKLAKKRGKQEVTKAEKKEEERKRVSDSSTPAHDFVALMHALIDGKVCKICVPFFAELSSRKYTAD